jgi:hypothetical protein
VIMEYLISYNRFKLTIPNNAPHVIQKHNHLKTGSSYARYNNKSI